MRFAIAVRTGVLLRPETRDRMWTSMKTTDGERVVRHDGGQPRVSTTVVLLPDRGVEVAIMCNLEGERLHALAIELARLVAE